MVVNLPAERISRHIRYKIVFTTALWYTAKEPKPQEMQLYMRCFVKQMDKLMYKGIQITHNDKLRTIYILPLIFAVDAPARAIIANRINHGGFYGCSWCYERGETIAESVKFPNQSNVAGMRSLTSYLEDVKIFENLNADERKKEVLNAVSKVKWNL